MVWIRIEKEEGVVYEWINRSISHCLIVKLIGQGLLSFWPTFPAFILFVSF